MKKLLKFLLSLPLIPVRIAWAVARMLLGFTAWVVRIVCTMACVGLCLSYFAERHHQSQHPDHMT